MKCTIEGCAGEIRYSGQGVCQTHYFRFRRTGQYQLTPKTRKPFIQNPAGYVKIWEPTHTLANTDGYVYEHRKIIYARHGDALPPCELCHRPLTWKTCHVDHRDEVVTNNSPENLRPLCIGCNTSRSRPPEHTIRGRIGISFDGITQTAYEWSQDPRVKVSHATITRRMAGGMSAHDALFSPKKTHKEIAPC